MVPNQSGTKFIKHVNKGKAWPLGSSITEKGVNFSVAAPKVKELELILFQNENDALPSQVINLNHEHKSGDYWHAEIEGIGEGAFYGYRVIEAASGISKNLSKKILLDPCARAIGGWDLYKRGSFIGDIDNTNLCLKGIVSERDEFDFHSHPRPNHKLNKTVIYELHVGAFTKDLKSNIPFDLQGTLLGLKQKIPYLRDLGITTIELLPIFSFDPYDAPPGKKNFWGYSPLNWFTPHIDYIQKDSKLTARNQVRDFIASCHDNKIEVIIDVVYNHTSEGNERGPVISWKGLADDSYYHHDKNGNYLDVSGCGNSVAANEPLTRKLIIESMKCWSVELGVDGFRFDLGIALSRGEELKPLGTPPLFEEIEAEPALSNLKLISEPWDCGGLYKISDFPAKNFSTWNGHFRDDIRKFWKGDKNSTWPLKDRLNGNSVLYGRNDSPKYSVNFITSHDGFTLNDLVSFNSKHNFANGENNRDGENHNNSWNHGVEGPSNNKETISLRNRQKKNMITSLLLSPGIPMLLMGDECSRSQGGNNNAWCQDNPIGWMIWDQSSYDNDLNNYIKFLLKLRYSLPEFFSPEVSFEETNCINQRNKDHFSLEWHGIKLKDPDWSDWSHTISYSINKSPEKAVVWIGLNAYTKAMKFELPKSDSKWVKLIDTRDSSLSVNKPKPSILSNQSHIELENRSTAVIISMEYFNRIQPSSN